MPEGHRAAIYVDPVAIEVQVALELFGNDCKSLIDLEKVDVREFHSCALQNLLRGGDRSVEHQRRAITHIRSGDHTRSGLQVVGLGVGLAREEDRGGAIDDTRRVAGMMDVLDLKVRVFLGDQLTEGEGIFGVSIVG